ncbi:MAG: biopolymer transporter ExbD [Methylacidiphilales bacterium]|nr:biopolymer transporter ExbD [Candidatus Methylacidiphilales bacterium]
MAGGGSEEGEFGLQIAPMLDVMFVLLLFFMVGAGANASKEGELGIKVPGQAAPSNPVPQEQPIVLSVDAEDNVRFNDQPMGEPGDAKLEKLRAKLKEVTSTFGEQPVIISPDGQTKHSRLIQVLDACSYAKVKKLSFRYVAPTKK